MRCSVRGTPASQRGGYIRWGTMSTYCSTPTRHPESTTASPLDPVCATARKRRASFSNPLHFAARNSIHFVNLPVHCGSMKTRQ